MASRAPIIGTDDLIATAAFRYALGRQSYIVSHIVSWLRKNRNRLSPDTCARIIQEIHDAAGKERLGMAMDQREWIGLAAALERSARKIKQVA